MRCCLCVIDSSLVAPGVEQEQKRIEQQSIFPKRGIDLGKGGSVAMSRILVVDDDAVIRTYFYEILRHQGYEVETASNGQMGLDRLKGEPFNTVICDYRLPDMEADHFLREAKPTHPDLPVIIITGYSSLETAVNLMKLGAFNYLIKPVMAEQLLSEVTSALDWHYNKPIKSKKKAKKLSRQQHGSGSDLQYVMGISEESKFVQNQIKKVAKTNYSVLLYGESGTGKEIAAWTLHKLSNRSKGPFIAVDCGVLTTELARSELFGHVKGAYTGADQSKQGKFQLADGGTLFLDEILNLSYDVQGYLLRAIQERKVSPVGSGVLEPVDVRIVVASNVSLKKSVAKGRFREDLYHRLHEFSIELPALRTVKEEIMHYANHYLHQVTKELDVDINGFAPDVIDILESYSWPGNFRELKNVVKRACLFAEGNLLTADTLHPELVHQAEKGQAGLEYESRSYHAKSENGERTDSESLKLVSDRAEKEKIVRVLKRVNYNKSAAARSLNIDRKTLYNKLKKYNINGSAGE